MDRGRLLRGLALAALWLVVSVVAGLAIFLGSSRTVVLASHDAVLRPTLDGYVVLRTGPVLPDLRIDSGHRIGVDIILGKTNADSTEQLVQRYGYIASQPEGQVAKVQESVADMAFDAAVRGGRDRRCSRWPSGCWWVPPGDASSPTTTEPAGVVVVGAPRA